ncbi:hypothetical protein LZL87_009117 [Fusarium oxysporum]|nr:hypothetical protein LZL87_009117 [Fusarium oxysporum]
MEKLLLGALAARAVPRAMARPSKPNIVVIMSDDQDARLGSLQAQPFVREVLSAEGLKLENHFATVAQRFPSRTSFLRGQASHNTNLTHVGPPELVERMRSSYILSKIAIIYRIGSNLNCRGAIVLTLKLRNVSFEVLRLIRTNPDGVDISHAQSPFMQILHALEAWNNSISTQIQLKKFSIYVHKELNSLESLLYLHRSYHIFICDLTRISIPGFAFPLAAAFRATPQAFISHCQDVCRHHAAQVTKILRMMTIVVVPIYQVETAPNSLRGLVTSSLQLMILLSSLVASLVIWGTSSMKTNAAWHIPVGLQFLAPTFLLALWFWVPESPRWLLAKDRVEDATRSLRRIRKDKSEEDIEFEIQAIQHAHSNDHKGKWSELFDAKNRHRTMVAILAMFGQQITGQAFASQYSVIFYLSQVFGARSFVFSVLSSVAGLACLSITWFTVDLVSRRVLFPIGGTGMAIFLFIAGSVGTIKDPTETQKNTLVASFILFSSSYALSWAPVSYFVVSEAASSHIKEKTNLLASVISVLTTFATSFTLPYLLSKPYAGLGAKVGFIYGSFCVAMVVLAYFFIPELKGRSLEEVDQLFASGQPLRKLGSLETRTADGAFESGLKQQPRTEVKELV